MKKKLLLSLTLLLLITGAGVAQKTEFPEGIYKNFDQLKARTPAFKAELQAIKRTSGNIAMMGGNDYKLQSATDTLHEKYLKTKVFAYVKNDSLFINGLPTTSNLWYSLCLTKGNFLVFPGSITEAPSSVNGAALVTGAVLGGAVGGAIAGTIAGVAAAKKGGGRLLYVLSLRTGNVRYLTQKYINARLAGNPELLNQYNAEKKPKDNNVLIKYMNLLNETVLVDSLESTTEETN